MSSTTTRAGAIALAASLATALTAAGGAGAIDVPRLPVVQAAQQDVSNTVSSVQPVVDNVAPNTRAAVASTVNQVSSGVSNVVKSTQQSVSHTVKNTQQTVSHTVKATNFVAASAATQAVQAVNDTTAAAGRTVKSTSQFAGRVTDSTSRTVGDVKVDVNRLGSHTDAYLRSTRRALVAQLQRISAQLSRFLQSGSIGAARSVMGGWQLSWTRSSKGCMSINNQAPDLLLLQPFHIGVESNGRSAYIGQHGTSSSLDISC